MVIVSGHLDSWDAQGAIDDGAGVAAAMGVVEVLKSLGLHARRTVRFVAWMDEENGGSGSKAYFKANAASVGAHAAAIESDNGAGRPLGVSAHVVPWTLRLLKPIVAALALWAQRLEHRDGVGADIDLLDEAGVLHPGAHRRYTQILRLLTVRPTPWTRFRPKTSAAKWR